MKNVLVARAIFAEVVDKLRAHFAVRTNEGGDDWSQDRLIAELQGCQGVFIAGTEKIDTRLLDACPQLRAVCTMAVGYNNIDVAACAERGVTVTNAPDVLTETTADLGFALMLAAARRVAESEHHLRAGQWKRWSYDFFCGAEVHGTTLGILGMGRIGQALARRGALGFGTSVIYHNRSRLAPEVEAPLSARWVSKDELLRQADHLVLVLPYSPSSHHAIGAAELAQMKPTATLTNIARGGIVDDAALAQALAERRIAAAGLDVFEGEPAVHPGLLKVPNVVLTPHIGSATVGTRLKMATLAADNLIAVLNGQPALTPVTPVRLPQG
jgi:glyoxylate/hydroxypyruvate/2-ketogluconate reductase